MAIAEVSVSTDKVFEKLGRIRTGVVVIFSFNVVKAASASALQENLEEDFSRLVSGSIVMHKAAIKSG